MLFSSDSTCIYICTYTGQQKYIQHIMQTTTDFEWTSNYSSTLEETIDTTREQEKLAPQEQDHVIVAIVINTRTSNSC